MIGLVAITGTIILVHYLNTLRPRQDGRYFPDDNFKCIFLNENVWISIKISLKFVPKGSISNIPALVQIMAWRRPGDKPLSEPMMVSLLTHICVTRPQWVKVKSLRLIWRSCARRFHLRVCDHQMSWTELTTNDGTRIMASAKFAMMTSSNGSIFRATGPLCGEFTGRRWIPLTKASDAELWYFLWSAPE